MNNFGQSKYLDQIIDQINKNLDDKFNPKSALLDHHDKCEAFESVLLMNNLENLETSNLLASDLKINDRNSDHFSMNEHKSTANSQNDKLVNDENISKDNNELANLTSIKNTDLKLIDKLISEDSAEANFIDQLPSPSPSLLNCNLSTDETMVNSIKSINQELSKENGQENGQDNPLKNNCSM